MSDIKFNGGYNNCEDRMSILRNSVVQRRLDKFNKLSREDLTALTENSAFVYVDGGEGKDERVDLLNILHADHVNPDWDITDPDNPAYIKNKPDITSTLLKDDMTAYYSVGGIHAGDVFAKGTSIVDIIMKMLSLEAGEYLFYGINKNIPTEATGLTKYNITKAALLTNGFTMSVNVDNQYCIVAVPKFMHVDLEYISQEGYKLGFVKDPNFNGGTCNMYYTEVPATGVYTLHYKFIEENETND